MSHMWPHPLTHCLAHHYSSIPPSLPSRVTRSSRSNGYAGSTSSFTARSPTGLSNPSQGFYDDNDGSRAPFDEMYICVCICACVCMCVCVYKCFVCTLYLSCDLYISIVLLQVLSTTSIVLITSQHQRALLHLFPLPTNLSWER